MRVRWDSHNRAWLRFSRDLALKERPFMHPQAVMDKCLSGRWTYVDEGVEMLESTLGDYSYVMRYPFLAYTEVGKFCSIASFVRLNPGNHPMDRVTTHHLTYRRRIYKLADLDDEAFFEWRRTHKAVVGHGVWSGHEAILLPGVTVGTGAIVGA